jgi:transcriptional regulator with XRE-family HTH domain
MQNPTINVKKLREERGWLQQESADRLGFSRSYLSDVESGRYGISFKMMNAIIRVFKVKYEDFYKDGDISENK